MTKKYDELIKMLEDNNLNILEGVFIYDLVEMDSIGLHNIITDETEIFDSADETFNYLYENDLV